MIILTLSMFIIFKVSHLRSWATCPIPANLPNNIQRSSLNFVVTGLYYINVESLPISLRSVDTVDPFALLTLNRSLFYSTLLDYFLIVSDVFCISAVATVFTHRLVFPHTPCNLLKSCSTDITLRERGISHILLPRLFQNYRRVSFT
jgi:hypothetical protein